MAQESSVSSVDQRSHLRGLVEVGAASVLWGTGGLAVQLIREHVELSPVTISAWRMTIAAAGLLVALVVLRRVGELAALARSRPRQLLAVGVGTAAYQGFYFVSVTQVGVAVSTVVSLGLAPVLLTVADSVRHRRAPAGSRLAVLGAALTGLVLVSVAGHESSTGPAPVAGVLLAVASGTTYALTTAAGGSISQGTSPLVLTSGMTLVGAAVLLPCLVLVDGPRVSADPFALAWLLYLGALTMALAYVLLYSGLRVVSPSSTLSLQETQGAERGSGSTGPAAAAGRPSPATAPSTSMIPTTATGPRDSPSTTAATIAAVTGSTRLAVTAVGRLRHLLGWRHTTRQRQESLRCAATRRWPGRQGGGRRHVERPTHCDVPPPTGGWPGVARPRPQLMVVNSCVARVSTT